MQNILKLLLPVSFDFLKNLATKNLNYTSYIFIGGCCLEIYLFNKSKKVIIGVKFEA